MFKHSQEKAEHPFAAEIESIRAQMSLLDAYSVEYTAMAHNLKLLYEVDSKEEKKNRSVSPDVVATIAGNLAGIVMILTHERTHVIASKALGFVLKAR